MQNLESKNLEKTGKKKLLFPSGFFWGAGTASHQIEGGNNNSWTKWEKKNAERLSKEASAKWESWQREKFPEMFDPRNYVSGKACDSYNRYAEDFDLAKIGGHNAHRFSIEWSRVEPEEGKFDDKEIEHYCGIIMALRERGIEPFVTLWHWTEPVWFDEKGGWTNKKSVGYFLRYVEKMVNSLGDQVNFWLVLNEPNVCTNFGYFIGTQPPAKEGAVSFLKAYFNLLDSYRKSYRLIHRLRENAKVGFVNSFVLYEADVWKPINGIISGFFRYFSRYFFNHTENLNDFIGCNYYSRNLITPKKREIPQEKRTDLGWEIYPEGIYEVLMEIKKYNLPIYITENGLADADDSKREKFIEDHLDWISKAMEEGTDVRGYFHWSLLDNFEFPEVRGFWPRFGLIGIDFKTFERKPRKSFYSYKEMISNQDGKISTQEKML